MDIRQPAVRSFHLTLTFVSVAAVVLTAIITMSIVLIMNIGAAVVTASAILLFIIIPLTLMFARKLTRIVETLNAG